MQTWVIRISLVAFGLLMGLAASEAALHFLRRAPKGSEFKSLDDLRASMLRGDPDAKDDGAPSERSTSLGAIINPHPDDLLIYDLRPNLDTVFQGAPVRTNSCGMRSRETPVVKPAGTRRVAFLGDSFTFGWGVKAEESFPSVVEENLNRLRGGNEKIEVLNFGVPGYSTFQEVALFKDRVLDFAPDVVLVYFVENDFGLPFYVQDLNEPGRLMPSLDLFRLASKALGKNDADRFQSSRFDPNKALGELAKLCEARGIPLLFVINPKKAAADSRRKLWVLKENRYIKELQLYGDFKRAIKVQQLDIGKLRLPTDPHPSALKHRVLGDIMTPYVAEALAR